MPDLEEQPAALQACYHHWIGHLRGGEPLSVRICSQCGDPDWDDLRRQLDERDTPFAWRLVKRPDSKTAQIELGDQYADLSDAELTVLMHGIGRGLIQAGTIALQSRVGDDEDDGWDD